MKTRAKKTRKKSGTYTPGELDQIIDATIHPLFQTSETFRLIDILLHGLA